MKTNSLAKRELKPILVSENVMSPFSSIFDYWPTKWTSFFDFDYNPTGITVGGNDNKVSVNFDVSGFDRADIKTSVSKHVLTVECQNSQRRAFYSSTIPYTSIEDTANVKLENGVLTVTFDRSEESKPRVLDIK